MEITHFLSHKIALSKRTITGVREVLTVQNAIRITGNNGAGNNGVLCLFVSQYKSTHKSKQTHFIWKISFVYKQIDKVEFHQILISLRIST